MYLQKLAAGFAFWLALTAQSAGEAWEIVSSSRRSIAAYDTAGLPTHPQILYDPTEQRRFRVLLIMGPDFPSPKAHHVVAFYAANCSKEQVAAQREIGYDAAGKVVWDENEPGTPQPINQGVVAGAIAHRVCAATHAAPAPKRRFASKQQVIAAYQAMLARPVATRPAPSNNEPSDAAARGLELYLRDPSEQSWRDLMVLYGVQGFVSRSNQLDLLRLMRATKTLQAERDWILLAQLLDGAGLIGEAHDVTSEALARGSTNAELRRFKAAADQRLPTYRANVARIDGQATPPSNQMLSVADGLYGLADYGRAIARYQSALGLSGMDPSTISLRLGAALYAAGRKEDALRALKAVQGEPSVVAKLWIAYLTTIGGVKH